MREGFYDYENVVENVAENVVERFSDAANKLLKSYSKKKCETAKKILSAIARDNSVTIAQIAGTAEINDRTVQRYLKEFQDAEILRREGSDTDGKWILM